MDWQLYHSFYGNMKDPVDTQFIMCVCNSLGECNSIDDALNGATIHGNFSSVPGKLAQAQASALYLFVFRFLFPGLYLITGTMALIFLIITMHRIKRSLQRYTVPQRNNKSQRRSYKRHSYAAYDRINCMSCPCCNAASRMQHVQRTSYAS